MLFSKSILNIIFLLTNLYIFKWYFLFREVKSTIQEEIKEIATHESGSIAYKESLRGLNFNITEGDSAQLNDTNASEIQRILGSYEDSNVVGNASYLDGSKYLIKLKNSLLCVQPKIIFFKFLFCLRVLAHSMSGYKSPLTSQGKYPASSSTPARPRATSKTLYTGSSPQPFDFNQVLESFHEDVSRSFKPIQMELANSSSNSGYRSSSSTPTNAQ